MDFFIQYVSVPVIVFSTLYLIRHFWLKLLCYLNRHDWCDNHTNDAATHCKRKYCGVINVNKPIEIAELMTFFDEIRREGK